jgi:hypothetical protein
MSHPIVSASIEAQPFTDPGVRACGCHLRGARMWHCPYHTGMQDGIDQLAPADPVPAPAPNWHPTDGCHPACEGRDDCVVGVSCIHQRWADPVPADPAPAMHIVTTPDPWRPEITADEFIEYYCSAKPTHGGGMTTPVPYEELKRRGHDVRPCNCGDNCQGWCMTNARRYDEDAAAWMAGEYFMHPGKLTREEWERYLESAP